MWRAADSGIGDGGAAAIGDALKSNTTLTELSLNSKCVCVCIDVCVLCTCVCNGL